MLRKLEVAGTNLASDLSQLTAVWKVGPCLRSEVLIACAHPVQQNTVLMMPRMLSSPLSPRPLSPTTGQTHIVAHARLKSHIKSHCPEDCIPSRGIYDRQQHVAAAGSDAGVNGVGCGPHAVVRLRCDGLGGQSAIGGTCRREADTGQCQTEQRASWHGHPGGQGTRCAPTTMACGFLLESRPPLYAANADAHARAG